MSQHKRLERARGCLPMAGAAFVQDGSAWGIQSRRWNAAAPCGEGRTALQDDGVHFSTITENCFSGHHQNDAVVAQVSCESCHATSVSFLHDDTHDRREPSPHARADVSCAACHRLDALQGVFLDVKETCVECHKATPAKGELYDAWHETLAREERALVARIAQLEAITNRTPADDQRLERLREAQLLLRAEGMHNIHAALQAYETVLKEPAATGEQGLSNPEPEG